MPQEQFSWLQHRFSRKVLERLKFGEEIGKNLFDQRPSPFRLDFQYFSVNSSLKWRMPHIVICLWRNEAFFPKFHAPKNDSIHSHYSIINRYSKHKSIPYLSDCYHLQKTSSGSLQIVQIVQIVRSTMSAILTWQTLILEK